MTLVFIQITPSFEPFVLLPANFSSDETETDFDPRWMMSAGFVYSGFANARRHASRRLHWSVNFSINGVFVFADDDRISSGPVRPFAQLYSRYTINCDR
ncbi:hypothetical protein BaRGS_00022204 [Batillaria attramentaria]|uniref:Uncharacterized protein n=1 Tax=Batillaria attramentaria TaxID=370345 RepID=A0ABD0KH76_9CAEN